MTDGTHFDKDYTCGFRGYQFLSFMVLGIVNPLLPKFFDARGMDKTEVGMLMAIFGLMALAAPPVWGMAADASRDRRVPLLLAFIGTAVTFCGFYLCETFATLVGMMVLFGAMYKAVIPMGIGLTFAWVETQRKDYSRIRLFGTLGYVAALLVMALPMRLENINVIFPCFVIFAAAAAVGLKFLPKIAGTGHRKLDWRALRLLGRRDFAITVVCTFFAQAAMSAHYSFFTQYALQDLNVSQRNITFFWAFGSVFEVVMLTQAGRLIKRFGTRWVLTAGMAGIALRLGLYALVPFWPVIFLAQGMHAFTFGAVHASTVTFVNYAAPTKWRASAQTLFEGITIGLGMSLGALIGGQIGQHTSYRTLFGCAAGAAAAAALAYALFGRSASLVRTPEEMPAEGLKEE